MSDETGDCEDIVDVLDVCRDLSLWAVYRCMLLVSEIPKQLFSRFLAIEFEYRAAAGIL